MLAGRTPWSITDKTQKRSIQVHACLKIIFNSLHAEREGGCNPDDVNMSTIGRYLRNNIHNIFTYRRLMHNMTIWNDLSTFLYIIAAKKDRFENTSGYNNTHVTANQTLLLLYIVSV